MGRLSENCGFYLLSNAVFGQIFRKWWSKNKRYCAFKSFNVWCQINLTWCNIMLNGLVMFSVFSITQWSVKRILKFKSLTTFHHDFWIIMAGSSDGQPMQYMGMYAVAWTCVGIPYLGKNQDWVFQETIYSPRSPKVS